MDTTTTKARTGARVYSHYPMGATKRQPGRPALRTVKNLGWLLRHAGHLDAICLTRHSYGATLTASGSYNDLAFTYIADFASWDVARRWVRRPSLAHVILTEIP